MPCRARAAATHRALRLLLLVAAGAALSGCAVVAAADLAATTVFTAGKLVVKGTGAVVDALIPDGDEDNAPAQND